MFINVQIKDPKFYDVKIIGRKVKDVKLRG